MTNVGPDVQDLYEEQFDPANPQALQDAVGLERRDVRHEEIKVRKGFTESTTDIVPLDVTVTRHGPIVFEKDGKRYALKWTALDPKLNNPDSTYSLNRARNWKEFNTALRRLPRRRKTSSTRMSPDTSAITRPALFRLESPATAAFPTMAQPTKVIGPVLFPSDKLPIVYDPPSGIIVTANQRIVGTDYPYFLTHSWAQPYRARRIFDLLNQTPKLSADDFRRIQGTFIRSEMCCLLTQIAKILSGQVKPEEARLAAALGRF